MSNDSRIFYLKYRDILPILDVVLYPPGQEVGGTPQDLAGSTGWKLHIRLASGAIVTRDMSKVGADADGKLRYAWVAADWTDLTTPLVVGEHTMEYEVLGPGSARLTFPNDSYHRLRIQPDIGQG